MKTTYFTLLLGLFFLSEVQAQRFALIPQKCSLKQGETSTLQVIPLDYDLAYTPKDSCKQVYHSGDIALSINENTSLLPLDSLIQGKNPLLFLLASSPQSLSLSLNPLHPANKNLKTLDFEVQSHAQIGQNPKLKESNQAELIFKAWSEKMSVADYEKYAKCLDIVENSNLLRIEADGSLSDASRKLVEKLYKKLDFGLCNGKTFKQLAKNHYWDVNENGDLLPESRERLKHFFYYKAALTETEALSYQWKQYAELPDTASAQNLSLKTLYYTKSHLLDDLSSEKDTLIEGERHILMLAWKSKSFFNYVDTTQKLATYTSFKQFFTYPLFLTPASDMQRWVKSQYQEGSSATDAAMRMKQLLGLPPHSSNELFVEFWVKEADLFRPALDSSLRFANMPFKLENSYKAAFADFARKSFEDKNLFGQYPFTGLGYTYDYHPQNVSHKGVTELVLRENRKIYIRRKAATQPYLEGIRH